jgi:hypothetical protein
VDKNQTLGNLAQMRGIKIKPTRNMARHQSEKKDEKYEKIE